MESVYRVIEATDPTLVEAWNGRTVLLDTGFSGVISLAPPVYTSEMSTANAEVLAKLAEGVASVERREWISLGELALWACQFESGGHIDAQLVLGFPFDRRLILKAVRAMAALGGESSDAVYLELVLDRLVNGRELVEARCLRASLIKPETRATFVIAQLTPGCVGDQPFEVASITRPVERAP